MPIRTAPATLQQLIFPGVAIRDIGEAHVDVDSNTIRLRARSEDKTAYLDHHLPIPALKASALTDEGSFWLNLELIEDFLNACGGDVITVKFPFETQNSTITLRSEGLTYRFAPITDQQPYRLFDLPSFNAETEFRIPHEAFARAIQIANLVGEELQLRLDPETYHLEFAANATGDGDAFSYVLPVEQIDSLRGSASNFTISIERLREFTARLLATSRPAFFLTSEQLVYHTEYPVNGAELTLHIAERLGTIPE